MTTIAIWWAMLTAAFRSEAQYRANFVIQLLGGALFQGVGLILAWLIVSRFHSLGGWSAAEVGFVYGLRLAAHGLWVLPMGQLLNIEVLVRQGHFDRFLIRPTGTLVQVVTHKVNIAAAGDLVSGLLLLSLTGQQVLVNATPYGVAYLGLAVVGGAMTEGAIQLAIASLTFRHLETRTLRTTADSVFNTFGGYPLHAFGSTTRLLLTFVLPVAFVGYLPATVLIGRTGDLYIPAGLAYGAPLVGLLLFCVALIFWHRQVRAYQSVGH